jgi:hypothetical protein
VEGYYQMLLRRSTAGDPLSQVWVQQLQGGASAPMVLAEIVADPNSGEFFARTAP